MTSDELINLAFRHQQTYEPEALYRFAEDDDLMHYLHTYYPEAYDFLHLSNLTVKDTRDGIAAVTVVPNLILYLNPHKLTFMKEQCGLLDLDEFYKTFACLVIHESLHYYLKHFRFPFAAYHHQLLNVAQDMVIDNQIHLKNPGWRNWQQKVDEINRAIDAQQRRDLPKLSTDPADPYFLLNLSDKDVYFYLDELNISAQSENQPPRFDNHNWDGSNSSAGDGESTSASGDNPADSSGNSSEDNTADGSGDGSGNTGTPSGAPSADGPASCPPLIQSPDYDDILGKIAQRAQERLSQNSNRPWISQNDQVIDRTIQIIAKGKDHNLFALLKKFIKKMSYKQRTLTWKKMSKKQPYAKPGSIYKKTPGEVLILIDTSYSMYGFIADHIADTMNGIYAAFAQVARNYGLPSKMYKSDFAEKVLNFKQIKTVEELQNVELAAGGATSLAAAFAEVVDQWHQKTKSTQHYPDFILIITDFGDDYTFLKQSKYRALANKIIWLGTTSVRESAARPPCGIVVNVLADDWLTGIR